MQISVINGNNVVYTEVITQVNGNNVVYTEVITEVNGNNVVSINFCNTSMYVFFVTHLTEDGHMGGRNMWQVYSVYNTHS